MAKQLLRGNPKLMLNVAESEMFSAYDQDGDGKLSGEEYLDMTKSILRFGQASATGLTQLIPEITEDVEILEVLEEVKGAMGKLATTFFGKTQNLKKEKLLSFGNFVDLVEKHEDE